MRKNQEKYRKILKTLNLKKEQEDFIIEFVCRFMEDFVLAAHGKHPVQLAKQDKQKKPLNHDSLMVNSSHLSSFNDMARNAQNKE